MRLPRLGLTWRHRLLARVRLAWRRVQGSAAAHDMALVTGLRPGFFGRPFTRFGTDALRGPSSWRPEERELLAAAISVANRCPFCVVEHAAHARRGLPTAVVDAVLEGREVPDLDPRLAAGLRFVTRLSTDPAGLGEADALHLVQAGVSVAEVEDLVHVVTAMAVMNRVADALDLEPRFDELAGRGQRG